MEACCCLLLFLLLFFLPRLLYLVIGQGGNRSSGYAFTRRKHCVLPWGSLSWGTWPEVKTLWRQVHCVSKCEQATVKVMGRSQHSPLTACFYDLCSIFSGFVILFPIPSNSKRHAPLPSVKKASLAVTKHLYSINPCNSSLWYYFCFW